MAATLPIVMPAYNAERTIGEAVACAKAQAGLAAPPEVVVVDDGSTDDTVHIAEAAGARCVRQPNAGPAAARNKGFYNTRGKYVLFADSDCLPDPQWAARLVEALEEPGVGAAGGGYALANDGILPRGIQWEIVARHRRFGRYVRVLGSYNLAVRREVMDAVGGFDESYPAASGEDNDLCYRIMEAGYKLRWVPDAAVGHFHTERLGKYLKEQYRHGFWRAKLYRRHAWKMVGDDYTTVKDAAEPILVCAFVASLAVCWLGWFGLASAALLALLVLVQFPMTVRMLCLSKRVSVICHAGVMFFRAFARTAGFLLGGVLGLLKPLNKGRSKGA